MTDAPIKDPILHEDVQLTLTERGAQRLEINEKQCHVCQRRIELSDGRVLCGTNQRFPMCKGNRVKGFLLDIGDC